VRLWLDVSLRGIADHIFSTMPHWDGRDLAPYFMDTKETEESWLSEELEQLSRYGSLQYESSYV
jgi:hypothetical protein